MKLIIGNKNYSSWSLRPWFLMRAHNLDFEEIRIPLDLPNTHSEMAKYTDAARVPVLHDKELAIWDSLAICEYISEVYLAGLGWPTGLAARTEARSCSAEMHSGFFAVRENLPMNCRASDRVVEIDAETQKDISRLDQMWSDLRVRYAENGPWLFGEFSIADCMYAPVAFRFTCYEVSISEASREYIDTVLAHPAMQSWLEDAHDESEVIEESELGIQST